MENSKTTTKKKKEKSLLVKTNKKGRHILPFLNFLKVLVIPFYFLVKPFKFYGNKKIKDGAGVIICNHYTLFDAIYIASTTWEAVHFVAKREIQNMFLIGALGRGIKTIFVNRDGNDVRALLDCFKCLKNGEKIAIFPEGTRNRTGESLAPFQHGAAAMAIKAKAPVIPIMIYKKPKLFRCTHILIGDPLELPEYYDRKLSNEELLEADNKLRNAMLKLHEEHTQYLKNKKKRK